MSKYHNVKTEVDGITFASKREARRYNELKLLEKAGVITDLILQPKYEFRKNDILLCRYIADFFYVDLEATKKAADIVRVVEDAKGVRTPLYRLKKRMMKAFYGIEVQEV